MFGVYLWVKGVEAAGGRWSLVRLFTGEEEARERVTMIRVEDPGARVQILFLPMAGLRSREWGALRRGRE